MREEAGPERDVGFELPEDLEEKKEILTDPAHWDKLLKNIAGSKLSEKEVVVLRMYFTFLGVGTQCDDTQFLKVIS